MPTATEAEVWKLVEVEAEHAREGALDEMRRSASFFASVEEARRSHSGFRPFEHFVPVRTSELTGPEDWRTRTLDRVGKDARRWFADLVDRLVCSALTGNFDAELPPVPRARDGVALFSGFDTDGGDRFGVHGGNMVRGEPIIPDARGADAVRTGFVSAGRRLYELSGGLRDFSAPGSLAFFHTPSLLPAFMHAGVGMGGTRARITNNAWYVAAREPSPAITVLVGRLPEATVTPDKGVRFEVALGVEITNPRTVVRIEG